MNAIIFYIRCTLKQIWCSMNYNPWTDYNKSCHCGRCAPSNEREVGGGA